MNSAPAFFPFTYTITSAQIAGNGTGSATLVMAADSRFELHYILCSSSADAVTDVNSNNFSVQLVDQATGLLLSSGLVPQKLYGGTANNSTPELVSVTFEPNTIILATFTNLTAGNMTPNIALKGIKIRL